MTHPELASTKFGLKKLNIAISYMVQMGFDISNRLGTDHERDRQTDRTAFITIARSITTRAKKCHSNYISLYTKLSVR